MSKLIWGKSLEGRYFVWLDDPVPETNAVVAEHYPVAVIDGYDILQLRFETYSSLLSRLYNMNPFDINILRKDLGGNEKIKQILKEYRDNAVRNNNYSPVDIT